MFIKEKIYYGENINNLPLKVTFYARVSTDSDEQLNSLDNQINYFENYIKENKNWTYRVFSSSMSNHFHYVH